MSSQGCQYSRAVLALDARIHSHAGKKNDSLCTTVMLLVYQGKKY